MAKRSIYEVEAWQKVRNWRKCCVDSSRGGIVPVSLTGRYGAGGGREGDSEYEDFHTVEDAILATHTEEHRDYFQAVAMNGQAFTEGLRKTTEEQKTAWRILVQQIGFKIKEVEQRKIDDRKKIFRSAS